MPLRKALDYLTKKLLILVRPKPSADIGNIPDKNACVVHSLALVTGKDIHDVWKIIKHRFNDGVGIASMLYTIVDLGFGFEEIPEFEHKTLKNALLSCPSEGYNRVVIILEDHVIGVCGNKYVDTSNTKLSSRIEAAYHIIPIHSTHKMLRKYVKATLKHSKLPVVGILSVKMPHGFCLFTIYNGVSCFVAVEGFKLLGEPPKELYKMFVEHNRKLGVII